MGCPSLFAATHLGGDQLTAEQVDELHDQMIADEAGMFDSVMRGSPGPAPSKWSVLPSVTRSPIWDWLDPEDMDGEVLRAALED
jgi:hypothetical protein